MVSRTAPTEAVPALREDDRGVDTQVADRVDAPDVEEPPAPRGAVLLVGGLVGP